jgi:hypothetical protein
VSPSLTTYRFTAKIDLLGGTPPFPAALGDTVTGTFTLDPTIADLCAVPYQGTYVQKAPATVQVVLGSITVNADLQNWIGYKISVTDNDPNMVPSRDTFSWYVNDTVLASTYGLDYIQAGFYLDDVTGNVFHSDAMPASLNLADFDVRNLFLSGIKTIDKSPNCLWNLRAQITSLVQLHGAGVSSTPSAADSAAAP